MSPPAPIRGSLAKDRLGVPSVVFFVLSAATPMTVVAGLVTTAYAQTGVTGIPFGFVVIALLLMLFSVGYIAMSRHISNAGAFYTYITHGLGRPLGVGAAWMALLAYNSLQVGLYGIIGDATLPLLDQFFGITTEWWVIALVLWLIVAILGVLRVDINGTVLAFLLCAEIAIVLIYDVFFITEPAGGTVAFDTLVPSNFFGASWQAVGAVLVVTFLGFVGFEASVVFSEESKNPRRTIAMATFLSILIVGVTYVFSSWAMSVAAGPDNIVEMSQNESVGTMFVLAAERAPMILVDIGSVLFATSVLAAAISFHNTVARYTFALGRERVFPGLLSATGRRSSAPTGGSITQSLLGLAVIVVYVALDLDPVTQLFFTLGTNGGFGVMLLVTLTSLAVIAFFMKDSRSENVWRRTIAPALAFIALVFVVYRAVVDYHALLGVEPTDNLAWILPALYPAIAILGIIWALILKVARPDVYASIGLGANTTTGITTQSRVVAPEYTAQHSQTLSR